MARLPRGSRPRASVLILTIVVVVAASTVGPALVDPPSRADDPVYDAQAQLADRAPAEGKVTVAPRDDTGVVLVDIAHRNRLSQAELEPLLAGVTAAGYEIDLLEGSDDLDRSLTRADAFVVVDPSSGYSDEEVNRVEAFVDRGGRLLLVGEPTTLELSGFGLQTRVNRLTPLSSRFGFEFGEAHLFNMARNDGNHQNVFAEPAGSSRLTDGVDRTAFYAATQIHIREGQAVLVASEGTRSSRTDETGRYPVAAVNGNVLALADGSFLTRGNYNVVDNEQLIRNVVRFLVSGEKRRTLGAYPTFVSADPTIRFTGPALIDAAYQLAADFRAAGEEPTLTINRGPADPADTDVLVTTFAYLGRHGSVGTGITVSGDVVSVRGYNSGVKGVIVVRAPAQGYDLVVVADTPARALRAAHMLSGGTMRDHLLNRRTGVVRNADDGG